MSPTPYKSNYPEAIPLSHLPLPHYYAVLNDTAPGKPYKSNYPEAIPLSHLPLPHYYAVLNDTAPGKPYKSNYPEAIPLSHLPLPHLICGSLTIPPPEIQILGYVKEALKEKIKTLP
jgi:hypothetical protein